MSKKGSANVYWFYIFLAVVLILGLAWLFNEHNPMDYSTEAGRKQAAVFEAYTSSEQMRSYAEEAIKLSAFYALNKSDIPQTKLDCFNRADFDDLNFKNYFTIALSDYMEQLPLYTKYSEGSHPLYGNVFKWDRVAADAIDIDDNAASSLRVSTGNRRLIVEASSDIGIEMYNPRYSFIYSAEPALVVEVTCNNYERFMNEF